MVIGDTMALILSIGLIVIYGGFILFEEAYLKRYNGSSIAAGISFMVVGTTGAVMIVGVMFFQGWMSFQPHVGNWHPWYPVVVATAWVLLITMCVLAYGLSLRRFVMHHRERKALN